MVCSVQLEVLHQPSQARTNLVVDAAPDELCLKEIKMSRIVQSKAQCLKLRVEIMLRLYLHMKTFRFKFVSKFFVWINLRKQGIPLLLTETFGEKQNSRIY